MNAVLSTPDRPLDAIACTRLIALLQGHPYSLRELVEQTGFNYGGVRLCITALHRERVVRIIGWIKDRGEWVPRFTFGEGKDRPYPEDKAVKDKAAEGRRALAAELDAIRANVLAAVAANRRGVDEQDVFALVTRKDLDPAAVIDNLRRGGRLYRVKCDQFTRYYATREAANEARAGVTYNKARERAALIAFRGAPNLGPTTPGQQIDRMQGTYTHVSSAYIRPGALDHRRFPSRMGNRLIYRDGTVELVEAV